jgi:hypothetical protein
MEVLFQMKKDQTAEIVTFSNKIDECLDPIVKNDNYREKYKNIDMVGCLKFMCTNLKYDMSKINLWLMGWFNLFLSIDRLDLPKYMSCFFKEVMGKLGQSPNEVNQSLQTFLENLRRKFVVSPYIKSRKFCMGILRNLTESCDPKSSKQKLIEVFKWVETILAVQPAQQSSPAKEDEEMMVSADLASGGAVLTFEDIISDILLFTLQCLSNEDEAIKSAALKVNNQLQSKILDVVKIEKNKENTTTFLRIFDTLQRMISAENYTTVYYAMKWIEHLIDNFPAELTQLSEKIIKNLDNDNLKIVEISVTLISKIVNKIDDCDLIADVLTYLENMMKSDYDQTKSLAILKTLFNNIKGDKLLSYFAKALRSNPSKEFRANMIQNLDLVINIEENMHSLRSQIKDRTSNMFDTLFEIWCVDPISCISLSLLSERYETAFRIVQLMSFANMNVGMLIRLSQIVKLIDMPHYAATRMQLLRPKKYPYLVHTLKGILMLLPQGKAFDSLKNRLECSSLVFDAKQQEDSPVESAGDPTKYITTIVAESPSLFDHMDTTKIMEQLEALS